MLELRRGTSRLGFRLSAAADWEEGGQVRKYCPKCLLVTLVVFVRGGSSGSLCWWTMVDGGWSNGKLTIERHLAEQCSA